MRSTGRSQWSIAVVVATAICSPWSVAQEAESQRVDRSTANALEEIVVTAQKREQRLQDVPLAVSAYGAEQLENQAVQSLTDLNAKMPNVVLAPVGAFPYAGTFFIRGLGFADVESSFEPAVGVEVNGVYLARNAGALTDFFDIESVQVLRGPQGTLYGRNAIGGVVSIRTKRPDGTVGGAVQLTTGDHGRREGRASIEFPVVQESLAGRVAVLYKDYDGYWYNDTLRRHAGDNEAKAARATVVLRSEDTFDATLTLDTDSETGSGPGFNNVSLPGMMLSNIGYPADTGDPYVVHGDAPVLVDIDTTGASLEANWKTGPATLTSVTGWRQFDDRVLTDYDGSGLGFFRGDRDQTHEQFSEELRIASNGDGALHYVAGVYFLDQEYDIRNSLGGSVFGGALLTQIASQKNRAYAGFGQVDYRLGERWTLTAGGRYSYEEKKFTNQPSGFTTSRTYEDDWDDFSPKLGANYAFSDDLMLYALWARGFRSGGYNGRAGTFTSAGPYDPETVDSYEVGLKSEMLDGLLRLNLAVFSSKYQDMQLTVQEFTQAGTYESITSNAGKATIDGVEVESQLRAGSFTFDASLGYLDARFDKFFAPLTSSGIPTDNSSLPLSFAPEWSGSIGVTYEHSTSIGSLIMQVTATYTDDMYTSFTALNATSDFTLREANTLVDATAKWISPNERWKVSLWSKNLTDEHQINNAFSVGTLFAVGIYSPPRTWGLDLAYEF